MAALSDLPVPTETAAMEAKLVEALPVGPGWRYEPKWDGFRCLAFRAGNEIALRSKSGKALERFFPDVAALLLSLPVKTFVVDGELVIPVRGVLSFEALQMRLHPAASRVARLAKESPAEYILFDCLAAPREGSLAQAPFRQRRAALERLAGAFGKAGGLRLSQGSEDVARAEEWLSGAGGDLDGVIAKRLEEPYRPGERAMLKVKRIRTADCVVGGFRYAGASRVVGSLLLGLYDEAGRLDHIGFTSTITEAERPALTRKVEALQGEGFTGEAPGGPSRWSTGRSSQWIGLRPELVVEVRYDQVTGRRFRHGATLVRWRPDKSPRQCTYDQLRSEQVSALPDAMRAG